MTGPNSNHDLSNADVHDVVLQGGSELLDGQMEACPPK